MTKEELTKRIINYFPTANFGILTWDNYASHPITIKCLDCGTIKTYTRIYGIWTNKNRFCQNCSETISQVQVRELLEKKEFKFIRWADIQAEGKTVFRVEFQCPKCGQITNRRVWEMLHSDNECAWCGVGHRLKKPHALFEKEVADKFPNQYAILDEYQDAKTKIRVRHLECGFIFEISPDNLLRGKGCPRCNRYNSKGSQAIKRWLEKESIAYETEKTFDWSEHKRYDFYIPSMNLLIEFNGIQHYKPIPYFLKARSFEEQQASDIFKEEQAKKRGYNFLVIRYDQVDDIPNILSNTTTICNTEQH